MYDLYLVTGERRWLGRFKFAVDWIMKNLYLKDEGVIHQQLLSTRKNDFPNFSSILSILSLFRYLYIFKVFESK